MPIKTYKKFSKTEGRELSYLRWQGYQGGQWVQKHVGRAEVKAHKIRALRMEIDYLNELIDNLLSELVVRKQKVEALQAQLQELEDKGLRITKNDSHRQIQDVSRFCTRT